MRNSFLGVLRHQDSFMDDSFSGVSTLYLQSFVRRPATAVHEKKSQADRVFTRIARGLSDMRA